MWPAETWSEQEMTANINHITSHNHHFKIITTYILCMESMHYRFIRCTDFPERSPRSTEDRDQGSYASGARNEKAAPGLYEIHLNTIHMDPYGLPKWMDSIWNREFLGVFDIIRKGLGSIPQPGMIPNVACLRLETTSHKWSQWTVRFAGRHVASTIPMPDLISHSAQSHSKQRLCNGCHSFLRADWLVLTKPWHYSLCVNQGI